MVLVLLLPICSELCKFLTKKNVISLGGAENKRGPLIKEALIQNLAENVYSSVPTSAAQLTDEG